LGEAESVKLAWRAQTPVAVGESEAEQLLRLVETLEEDDDVQTVWGNYELSDEVLEKLG
jgi:transcriptional/translational regulatory protein YebC/TACO1